MAGAERAAAAAESQARAVDEPPARAKCSQDREQLGARPAAGGVGTVISCQACSCSALLCRLSPNSQHAGNEIVSDLS